MVLLQTNQDTTTLAAEMLPGFKEHLRILHDIEDVSIEMYLNAALGAIGIYAGTELYSTQYEVFYPNDNYDYSTPSNLMGWYCGKWGVSAMVLKDGDDVDITADYTIDNLHGMVYPHPQGSAVTFSTGYLLEADVPANLKNIIYRLGAEYYEMRESSRVGDPKNLPGWLTFALPSVWSPRV